MADDSGYEVITKKAFWITMISAALYIGAVCLFVL